ncbi:MAG: hypothetical protein LBL45_00110 [Treponema sp.]|nr:hypothetical protein [Treponema sp.]
MSNGVPSRICPTGGACGEICGEAGAKAKADASDIVANNPSEVLAVIPVVPRRPHIPYVLESLYPTC